MNYPQQKVYYKIYDYICPNFETINKYLHMKSKFYLLGLAFTLLLSVSACKSKQSAYQAAYEAAKAKELQEANNNQLEEVTPVTKPTQPAATGNFQKEKITSVDGNGILPYSVVIGSFINKTNAESLKERMQAQGYSPVLAQNEKGMYRVIVATFSNKSNAIEERESLKIRYSPEFSDAWLLERDN